MKTVGELKTFLNTLPDDMPIVHYKKGMEKNGYFQDIYAQTRLMQKTIKSTYDAFDGIPYDYEAFELVYNEKKKETAQLCLLID